MIGCCVGTPYWVNAADADADGDGTPYELDGMAAYEELSGRALAKTGTNKTPNTKADKNIFNFFKQCKRQ